MIDYKYVLRKLTHFEVTYLIMELVGLIFENTEQKLYLMQLRGHVGSLLIELHYYYYLFENKISIAIFKRCNLMSILINNKNNG